jgi:hypothetical protein
LRRLTLVIASFVLVAALISAAPAAAQTRAEYAVAADSICKRQSDLQERAIHRTLRRMRRHHGGERGHGIRSFIRLDAIFSFGLAKAIDNSIRQISLIPPPPGDELIVYQWLDSFHWDAVNARDAGRMASRKRVHFGQYFRLIQQASNHQQATALLVDGFGMRICASDTHYSAAISAQRLF